MNEQGWKNLSILVSTIYKNLQEYKCKFVSLEDLRLLFEQMMETIFEADL